MIRESIDRETIAVLFKDERITYGQLDTMSDVIASILREKKVSRNDVVPVIAKRSWHVIVAMLGIIKAGGAYLPISPDYPEARVKDMLFECGAKTILSFGSDASFPAYDTVRLEDVDFNRQTLRIENVNSPEDICYVLYTSGSTGKAKAVVIRHRNLVNFMDSNRKNEYQNTFANTSRCVLADTSFIFDISVFEIVLSLLNGKTIVLTEDMATPIDVADLIEKHHVDTLHTTPTKLRLWLTEPMFQNAFSSIRLLMCGAEEFTDDLYQRIRRHTDAVVYNGYGPTEITIGCCFKRIEEIAA